jgi:hypothetical protein
MSADRLAGRNWPESDAADPEFLLLLLLLLLSLLWVLPAVPATAAASLASGQAACSSAPTSASMVCTVSFRVFKLDLSSCRGKGKAHEVLQPRNMNG